MSRSSSAMGGTMGGLGGGLGKFTELRQRLLFVLGALIVYRIGCFIPVPGVNPDAMLQLMETQRGTIVDMFNMFSGGALERFSLLAIFQAWGIATALQAGGASQGIPVVYSPGMGFVLTAVIALTAGTMFLMWLGEQVTERGIGNGISLIIFAGI